MKLERIKSIILTSLVLLSIFLFWNLVTYQQNYDFIDEEEYVKEINIDKKKELKELIIPNKLIFRTNGTEFTGTEKNESILTLFKEIQKWNVYNFQLNLGEFLNRFEEAPLEDAILFQFPDDIPFDIIKSLFAVDAKTVPVGDFRYIFIFPGELHEEEGIVFFTTSDFKSSVKARVRYRNLQNFLTAYEEMKQNAFPYYVHTKEDGSYLFVLNSEMAVGNYQYYPRYFDTNLFRDALFPDPNFVTKNGNRYTDGSSLLDIFPDTKTLAYVDPTVPLDGILPTGDLIKTAVNYVNGHKGWTDRYFFSHTETEKERVIFQLYLHDYPVFSKTGSSEISLVIGENGIYSYDRPYFNLNISFNPSNHKYTLFTGQKILEGLKENESIDVNGIDDLLVGYHLKMDAQGPLLILEPSWFYRTDNKWVQVSESMDEGGMNNGLE